MGAYSPIWDADGAGPCEAGIDAIEPARIAALIARWGERFLGRIFTPAERALTAERPASLAARFAAKEAVAKALALTDGDWHDVEVLGGGDGPPSVRLSGAAAARAAELDATVSVSLTHTRGLAGAVAVLA